MSSASFCWWAYKYHRPLFDAMAYAGKKADQMSQLVWAVRMEEEALGHPFTAAQCAQSVVMLYADVAEDMPRWTGFVTTALAPTAYPAYRWLARRGEQPGSSKGLLQIVPSTFRTGATV